MLNTANGYTDCIRQSEMVNWNLEEEQALIALDFSRPFLPETMICRAGVDFLDARELRVFNHVQAHAYAHLFVYVEEIIIKQILKLVDAHQHRNRDAMRALLRFCEEEVKHQELFRSFQKAFGGRYGMPLRTIDNQVETAEAVCSFSPVSVMLLISMLEWVTQRHYIICFKTNEDQVDRSFARLFHLHWMEEAQHARIDTLEIRRLTSGMSCAEIDAEIDRFLELCQAVEKELHRQSDLDVLNLGDAVGRGFDAGQKSTLAAAMFATYRHAFIGMGLTHPVFLKLVNDLSSDRDGELLTKGQSYAVHGEPA